MTPHNHTIAGNVATRTHSHGTTPQTEEGEASMTDAREEARETARAQTGAQRARLADAHAALQRSVDQLTRAREALDAEQAATGEEGAYAPA